MVVLPLLSVLVSGWPLGYASAPYDPRWAQRYPQRAALMALAGPASNFVLVLLAALLINIGVIAGIFFAPETITFADVTAATAPMGSWWHSVAYFLGAFFALNLLLFVFNLLPIPPLDGSAALVLVLPEKWVGRYQETISFNVQLGWFGIFVAWQIFDGLFDPLFTIAISLLYPGISYS